MEAKTADPKKSKRGTSLAKAAWAPCRFAVIGAVLISMVMNVLVLTGPFYMLQIYDRVLPAHSLETSDCFQHFSPHPFCHVRCDGLDQNAIDGASRVCN